MGSPDCIMQLITVLVFSLLIAIGLTAVVFPDLEIQRDKRQEEGAEEPALILPCPDGELFCDGITDYPTNINIADSVVAFRLIRNAIFDAKPNFTTETPLL